MRRILAQTLQVRKARFFGLCLALCLAALGFLAFQYTMNAGSGYLDERAKNPAVVSTLFLWLVAALLGIFPSVLVGSFLGGKDEVGHTQASIVHAGGRLGTLGAKVGALLLVSAAVAVIVWAWGSLLGGVSGLGRTGEALVGERLWAQLAIVVAVLFLNGLLALTVATLTRSVALGNLIAFVVLLGQQFLPGTLGHALQWVNAYAYVQTWVPDTFAELSRVSAVTLPTAPPGDGSRLLGAVVLLVAQASILVAVSMRREVPA